MKKVLVLFIVCMICVSMAGIGTSFTIPLKFNKENIVSSNYESKTKVTPSAMASLKDIVDKYLNTDEKIYENYKESDHKEPESYCSPEPLLGGDEVFGLWIHIIYKDRYGNVKYDDIKKVEGITPLLIKGKLTNPNYRTPIKFNVDDDPEDDIEIGFGFFKSGIDEIQEDGSKLNHKAWTSAFDFQQVKSYLDDQFGELEVWQEFHVNLGLINSGAGSSTPSSSMQLSPLLSLYQSTHSTQMNPRIGQKSMQLISQGDNNGFAPLNSPMENILDDSNMKSVMSEPQGGGGMQPTGASEDYLVFRVGYRSPVGEKIPVKFEKEFSVARTTDSIFSIFRPRIFQHLMDPNDIIGTASNDVLFGFQAYRQGMSDPAYDIDFCVNFKPAVYLVTQFTPRWGKVFYYYHDCGSLKALDVTFSSEVYKGGDEQEGSLSLTLSIDPVGTVTGVGKWMCFDLDWGKFTYTASNKFNVAIIASSPRFEEKIQIRGIPTRAELSWGVDVDFVYVQGERLELDVTGSVGLDMSSKLDEIIIYYPKFDPNASESTFLRVSSIPSSNTFTTYGGLKIVNGSMLEVQAEGYVELDMSSQPGGIFLYYPQLVAGVPDLVLVKVNGIPSRERTGVKFILRVDPDLDNFFVNPNNYFFGRAYRDFSSNFGSIGLCLPNVTTPVIEVTQIPAHAEARGEIYWNRLEGYAKAERWSSGGPDPIAINLEFDAITINDVLAIRDGFIQADFKIAEDGYFGFDTSNEMIGNLLTISNTGTGNSISLNVGTISADNLWVDWNLDTSGEEVKIEDLFVSGALKSFKNFYVSVDLEGENFNFDGSWSLGDSGGFEIDFYQDEDIGIHFLNVDDLYGRIDLDGYAILDNDLHFDISWQWGHSGHFYINNNTNEPNLKELNFEIIYEDESGDAWYGLDITLYNFGIWVIINWIGNYWTSDIYISGQLNLDLLLNHVWYHIWP